MSSFSRAVRLAGLLVALAAGLLLAACSGLTPVYRTSAIGPLTETYRYSAPRNRLEQILLNDLTLKLGPAGESGPRIVVTVSDAARDLTSDLTSTPLNPSQVIVTAQIQVFGADGTKLIDVTRSQSADFTTNASVLASNQARQSAAEKATHLLADTVRLTVLGALRN